MAKNQGKIFEENWRDSYSKLPIYYLRLQDAAKWNRGEKSSFVPDSPYDSLTYKIPFFWTLELKSTNGTGISFNPNKPWEKPENKNSQVMIKANQVKQLQKACEYPGVISGFVLNYREKEMKTKTHPHETYFMHLRDFIDFAVSTGKSAVSREDAKEYGIEIGAKLKKTNYTYDVEKFCLESVKVYLNKGYLNKEDLIQAREYLSTLLGASGLEDDYS